MPEHDLIPGFDSSFENEEFFAIMYRSYTVHQSAELDRIALGLDR